MTTKNMGSRFHGNDTAKEMTKRNQRGYPLDLSSKVLIGSEYDTKGVIFSNNPF
jgi:hypothetical protein